MRALLTVFRKEFRENLRDRRTLWSALLFGPLFGPLLFGIMVSRVLDQNVGESDRPVRATVSGGERAPQLLQFLTEHGVRVEPGSVDAAAARALIERGKASLVLIVPPDYARRLRAGLPAPLLLVADSTDSKAHKSVDRLRALLAGYGGAIAQGRLQVRGVDPLLTVPIAVDEIDVATPAGRAVLVLGLMTYFVLFAMLIGGLYLAIDSTAGERERGSLEALLALPVDRSVLIGGKLLATCAFMALSLAISIAGFVAAFHFVPIEKFGMSANLTVTAGVTLFGICLPFVPFGAALMTLVASFARSYREAQTYLGTVLLVPTLPIAFAGIYSRKPRPPLRRVPSSSQHLLMTGVLKDQPLPAADLLICAAASLAWAALLIALTVRLWRRESLLG